MQQDSLMEKLTINTLRLLRNLMKTNVVVPSDFKPVMENMFGKLAICLDKNLSHLSLVAEVVTMMCRDPIARQGVAVEVDYRMSLL
jgi:hypothetical protein